MSQHDLHILVPDLGTTREDQFPGGVLLQSLLVLDISTNLLSVGGHGGRNIVSIQLAIILPRKKRDFGSILQYLIIIWIKSSLQMIQMKNYKDNCLNTSPSRIL